MYPQNKEDCIINEIVPNPIYKTNAKREKNDSSNYLMEMRDKNGKWPVKANPYAISWLEMMSY